MTAHNLFQMEQLPPPLNNAAACVQLVPVVWQAQQIHANKVDFVMFVLSVCFVIHVLIELIVVTLKMFII